MSRRRNRPSAGYTPPQDAVAEVRLRKPIWVYGEETSVIGVRECVVGDLMRTDGKTELESAVILVERCCNLNRRQVEELSPTDMVRLSDMIEESMAARDEDDDDGPFEDSQRTGGAERPT